MKITFLGTGTSSGVPMIACPCKVCTSANPKDERLRSSILISNEKTAITIDVGPDFRQQMLREKVMHLDATVITHAHRDHTGGLDEVRAFNFISGADFPIYLESIAEKTIRSQFDYAFAGSDYPGIPKITLVPISLEPFQIGELAITPIRVMHHQLPVLGFRIKDFTYITDANLIPEEEKHKIKGSKVLVLNALRREAHISHFTLAQALALVEEFQPEQAYFTHISHQLGLHDEVQQELPPGVQLAYDGLSFEI